MEKSGYLFEMELIESAGGLGRVGVPILFCRAAGLLLPNQEDASLVILNFDHFHKQWIEHRPDLTIDQAKEIVVRLQQLGIPGRLPAIEDNWNTSHVWHHFSLRIKFDDKRFYLDIRTEGRGFAGNDRENLAGLIRYLLGIAGID